jgi:hypothetical protein
MIHDTEELPVSRTPHLGLGGEAASSTLPLQSTMAAQQLQQQGQEQ